MADAGMEARRAAARRRLTERYGPAADDRALGSAVLKSVRGRAVERAFVSDAEAKKLAESELKGMRDENSASGFAIRKRRR